MVCKLCLLIGNLPLKRKHMDFVIFSFLNAKYLYVKVFTVNLKFTSVPLV